MYLILWKSIRVLGYKKNIYRRVSKKLNTWFIYRQQRLNVAYSTATVAFKYTHLWSWHKRVFGCSDRETSYGAQNFFWFPLTHFRKIYRLVGRHAELNTPIIYLMCIAIIKSIRTHGITLWVASSESNIEIIKRCQNFVLRIVGVAYRHDRNAVLMMTSVQDEIFEFIRNTVKRWTDTPVQKQFSFSTPLDVSNVKNRGSGLIKCEW